VIDPTSQAQTALAGYNCGNAGLRGERGQRYARRVWRLVKQLDRTWEW